MSIRLGVWTFGLLATLIAGLAGCTMNPPQPRAAADQDPFGPLEWLVSPTQGCPALLKAGSPLPILFRVPAGFAGRAEFRLTDPAASGPAAVIALRPSRELQIMAGPPPVPAERGEKPDASETPASPEPLATAEAAVPESVPPGLYDLTITLFEKNKPAVLRQKLVPRAVAVYSQFPDRFRFVQLSNMNIGDQTAPAFSEQLVEEVNRIAPAFIVTTGDYTEWASARDDPESWRRVKQYFARFDSPVFLTCGDLDHDPSFQRFVAPSKSNHFSFGRCHGILLYDNYRNPIDRDTTQILWMDSIVKEAGNAAFHFLITPNDSLKVFDAWKKLGFAPADYVRQNRIEMIFVGGYSDWDFVEYAGKRGDAPIQYVRTHASSTCIRGKATGKPHYRIVDVELRGAGQPKLAFVVPEDGPVQHLQDSVPVGRLKVDFDKPNDGSADRVKVTVLNELPAPVSQLRVKVNLARSLVAPEAVGGQIERVIETAAGRQVWLRIDCPDLGAAAAVVGPPDSLPRPAAEVKFQFVGDPVLRYRPARAADGFGYYVTSDQVQLQMVNESKSPVEVWPVIRLNGNVLTLKGASADKPVALGPGERRVMPINTPLGLASSGEHWLTVNVPNDPWPMTTRRAIELVVLAERAKATTQPE